MFPPTRWSLIAAAKDRGSPAARKALAELCQAYWYPLYGYVRHSGQPHEAAEDLTQAFFASFLEKDAFASADPSRGRLRSFLLASCKHFLANEHDRANAWKRGGCRHQISLPLGTADSRYSREISRALTPEQLFDRRWALALLDTVLCRLRQEYDSAGKTMVFEELKGCLTGDTRPHSEAAAVLGLSEGAVKVAAHRMRRRYRDLLRDEIGQTLFDPAEVDDEIRALFAALAP
jgi:RNA polymerase sigma factor (sigma-70 family)